MPNRILKESVNESRGLTGCSVFAQDLYKRLITFADDYGRFKADPEIMIARLYPRELTIVSTDDLFEALIELVGVDKITFYTAAGHNDIYGYFPNWGEHQRLRESKKKLPEPEDTKANEWFRAQYISGAEKAAIMARDRFVCQKCGALVTANRNAHRAVKLEFGAFHFDGRRLVCGSCHVPYTAAVVDELVQGAANCGNLRRIAANCGEQEAEQARVAKEPVPQEKLKFFVLCEKYDITIPPNDYRKIAELMEDGVTEGMMEYALEIALHQNKKSIAYIEGILNKWLVKGITTLQEAKQEDKARKERPADDPRVKRIKAGDNPYTD